MNSALMISCGNVGLRQICRDNIVTNGLSTCDHMKGGSPGAQTIAAYMREGVTNELKSHPFVCGSWKCDWWHCRSKSESDTYPLVSLSFAACSSKIHPSEH